MSDHEPSVPDRTESWASGLGHGVVRLILTLAVVCGAVAGGLLWDSGLSADRERAAHLHQVRATTTADVSVATAVPWPGAQSRSAAPAVWEYPDDVRRSGTVDVPPQTPKGRTLNIWVDDDGALARPPGATGELALTSFAGGLTVAGVITASGMGLVYLARRGAEDRKKLAAWEREWEQVEPIWSGRDGRDRRGSDSGGGDG